MVWGGRRFLGAMPRLDDRQLPPNAASIAEDCWLSSFRPAPLPAMPPLAGTDAFRSTVKTIFPYDQPTGQPIRWIQWDDDVDVVRAPVRDDTENRILWMGDGHAKQINASILQAGGGSYFRGNVQAGEGLPARRLGVLAPENAPTVTAVDLTNQESDQLAVFDAYVLTYVTDLGEEGPPSPPSAVVQRGFEEDGTIQTVTVGDLGTSGPTGANFYTKKRLYRTAVGTASTSYQFLVELPITTPSYSDSTSSGELGSGLVSQDWDPPDDDLRGLIALPNGVLAAFKGREIHFSEPYQPHAWPPVYIQVIEEDIVGLGNYGTSVVVGTKSSPYLVSGAAPAFATVAKMELDQACIAKRSFTRVEQQGTAYASPDGLVLVGPSGGRLLTRSAWNREGWQALNPHTLQAHYHDEAVVGFYDGGGFAFSSEFEGAISLSDDILASHRDLENDTIYVVPSSDNKVREWKASDPDAPTRTTMKWRSGLYSGALRTFSMAQVIAESYPVKLILMADGESHEYDVRGEAPFRLSAIPLASKWYFEVQGRSVVQEVRVGNGMEMI